MRELLAIAFDGLGLRRVIANCFAANEPSWRLMERIGMRREAHTVRDNLHRDGEWYDGLTYALLADEWRIASLGAQPGQGPRRGQGGGGGLPALVLLGALEAGPVQRLLVVVAREYAEADRHAGVERDPGQAVGGGVADVVEVRGATADDDAEGDDGVVPLPASASATTGSSKVPGTRTIAASVTWWAVSARSAPASRPSMTWVCQLAATTATFRPLASKGSVVGGSVSAHGAPPARGSRSVTGRSRGRAGTWPIRSRLVRR